MSNKPAANSTKFRHNSVRHWVLLRLALLLLCVGAIFWWGAYSLLEARFDSSDEEHYKQELLRVSIALKQNQAALETTIADYAYWDEAENFILGTNPSFIDDNFIASSMTNIQIKGVIITRLNSTPLASRMLLPDGSLKEMPIDFLALLTPHLALLASNNSRGTSSTLLWLNEQPFLISAVAVTDTMGIRPPSGYLYFLRSYHSDDLRDLSSMVLVDFELQQHNLKSSPELIINRYDSELGTHWKVSKQLNNLSAQIIVSGATHLKDERYLAFVILGASVAGLTFFSLLGVYLILNVRILNRLQQFSLLADQHRIDPNSHIRWPEKGDDELDNLASSLNELLDEVDVRHKDLKYIADHDHLTGIGNRHLLMTRLDQLMNPNQQPHKEISSLLLLDLDGFKLINDGLSHATGDRVLKIVAQRIGELIRNKDITARLGADEFAVLLEGLEPEKAVLIAERLFEKLKQPFKYDEHELYIRGSVGITLVDASLTKEQVLRNSNLAMSEAKRLGKGQIVVFSHELLDIVSRRMKLEQALYLALNEDMLEVWFQPIVDTNSGDVVSIEALSRWQFEGKYIQPEEFISIAEITGMISQLGSFVFNQAGAALKGLRVDYPDLQCNVNLSVRQFQDTDLVADIKACMHKYSLPTSALHLELTESMVAQSESDILPIMKKLVTLGYHFHLDDFGTGYSSLERLRALPFDTLKIDRSFIAPLNRDDDVMVRNIINIGQDLGMNLIAEGVETYENVKHLKDLGCPVIQGYYFAKPMPLNELTLWLSTTEKTTKWA